MRLFRSTTKKLPFPRPSELIRGAAAAEINVRKSVLLGGSFGIVGCAVADIHGRACVRCGLGDGLLLRRGRRRIQIVQLLLESFTHVIGDDGVGFLRVRDHLEEARIGELVGQILIHPAAHGEDVNPLHLVELRIHAGEGGCREHTEQRAQNNFMRIWYQRRRGTLRRCGPALSPNVYKSQRITVITPCLNEEQGIEQVLRRMPDFVDQVIVVDNGSTDRTSDIARSFGAEVIREPVRGYGRSYKRGFASATGDIIITLDGDHSYPPDAISYLLEALLHLDVDFLNASRFPVRDPKAMSMKHRIGNWVLSLAMSLLYFRWVRDSQSGMWVFRRSILEHMHLESEQHGIFGRDQN